MANGGVNDGTFPIVVSEALDLHEVRANSNSEAGEAGSCLLSRLLIREENSLAGSRIRKTVRFAEGRNEEESDFGGSGGHPGMADSLSDGTWC